MSITRSMVIPLLIAENLRKSLIDSQMKENWDDSSIEINSTNLIGLGKGHTIIKGWIKTLMGKKRSRLVSPKVLSKSYTVNTPNFRQVICSSRIVFIL